MSYISTSVKKNSTIMMTFSEIEEIELDPPYQRMGGVWTTEKKQLLIDSILNDYDLPKIYFHALGRDRISESGKLYSVIDGRQRLEAIWGFIKGEFTLSDDFFFQKDTAINLAGLSYLDIAKQYPKIRIIYDSFVLPIVLVETNDEELIEDMFSRLNEAVPLNAAEKRNSIPGDMTKAIRDVSKHELFTSFVKFSNSRYQHLEVSARFLLTELGVQIHRKIIDTKKPYLDAMAREYSKSSPEVVDDLKNETLLNMDSMVKVFTRQDVLLRSQGNMTLYYLLFRIASDTNELNKITRRKLIDFNETLKTNRELASLGADHSYELLEYDRLTQQGTNDSSNIKERLRVLAGVIGLSRDTI